MTAIALRSTAPPWAPVRFYNARMLRAWFWGAALALAAASLNPAPAHAGVIGETAELFAKKATDDPVAQKEIGEAVETLIEAAPDVREIAEDGIGAKGGPKGVSGPFQELVVNFDKMACAAWIISFRDTLLGLMLKRDPETPPETLRAAQNLLNKVVFACREVLDDTEYGTTGGGGVKTGGGTAGGGGGGDSGTGTTGGSGVDIVDGEAVLSAADRICWDRCRDEYAEWKGAEGLRKRAEARERTARMRADELESRMIPRAEARLAEMEREVGGMDRTSPSYNHARGAANNQRAEVNRMRADAKQYRQEAQALKQALDGLRQAEKDALQAYLDCMKSCADQARAAGDPSSFADATVEKLTQHMQSFGALLVPPSGNRPHYVRSEPSPADKAAMLAAIGGLRTGQASMSGTEVTLALPTFRDPGGHVRAEAAEAMHTAKAHGFGHHPESQTQPVEVPSEVAEVPSEPSLTSPPVEVEPAQPPAEFYSPQPPVEVMPQPTEFYCPDHPGMGPHSH